MPQRDEGGGKQRMTTPPQRANENMKTRNGKENAHPQSRKNKRMVFALPSDTDNVLVDEITCESDNDIDSSFSFTHELDVKPDSELWATKWAPRHTSELAVNPRKVEQVRKWLTLVFEGRSDQFFLVLGGPAGSGKTACISCICEELGIQVVEWINSSRTAFEVENSPKVGEQLAEFMSATLKYAGNIKGLQARPQSLILIEDLPSILHEATRSAVYAAYRHYASIYERQRRQQRQRVPVVFIVSEIADSVSADFNSSKFSYTTLKTVLPPDLLSGPMTSSINFKPVAPSFLRPAISRIVDLQLKPPRYSRVPSADLLQLLIDKGCGDVRFTINTLQLVMGFVDQRSTDRFVSVLTVPFRQHKVLRVHKKRNYELCMPSDEVRSHLEQLEVLISKRAETVQFYHSLGAVLYNKRESIPCRKGVADVLGDVEDVIEKSGAPPSFFADFLFENYLRFHGTDAIEIASGVADSFSAIEVLDSHLRASIASRSILYAHSQEHASTSAASHKFNPPAIGKMSKLAQDNLELALELSKSSSSSTTSLLLHDWPFRTVFGQQRNAAIANLCSFYGSDAVCRTEPLETLEQQASQLVASIATGDSWFELVDDIQDSNDEEEFMF